MNLSFIWGVFLGAAIMAIVYEIQMGRETYQPQNHTTGPADLFNIIERQKRLEQALKNEWRNP